MRIRAALTLTLAATLAAQPVEDRRLVFSTLHGGDRFDDAAAVAVDAAGNIYVTGETESRDLNAKPVGGKPLTSAVFKGYLTKYSPQGKEILWRLLIGGSSNTVPHAIALDKDGNVYVAGTTGARDLPLLHPVQDRQTGLNICFLMKFNPEGELLFSTYFGGERNEEALALAVDSAGNIYMAGRASSTNLPVRNAIQPAISGGGQDGFIAKFTADYRLEYATYFGGTGHTDNIYALAIGPDDSLYVAGETMSPGLATKDAYIPQPVSYSSFVAKLTPAGDAVTWFTYVGWKGGYTRVHALAVDASGRALVAGHTSSKQVATSENAIQREFAGGMRDAFFLRLNPDATAAEYLTYLGGSHSGPTDPDETATAIQIDRRGYVYITGFTNSPDFPGKRALQSDQAGQFDAFLLRLDVDHNEIISSTFWGGAKKDSALALALGPGENVTIAGETYSGDIPLARAVQTTLGSANDAFVTQVCDPWLDVWLGDLPSAAFSYVRGGDLPSAIEALVHTGCVQSFDAEGPEVDQPWLTVVPDGRSTNMKLRLEVNPDGLEPGEYKAIIKVTVKDAVRPVLEIPVTLTVTDPPPPLIEEPKPETPPTDPPPAR